MPKCNQCQENFPNSVKINGKTRNLQRRKYCLTCSPFGEHNTKQIHIHREEKNTKFCSKCETKKDKSHFYKKGKTGLSSYCKPCAALVDKIARQEKKLKLAQHTSTECLVCHYDKCIAALEYHHLDPSTKKFQISQGWNRSFKEILKEAQKCVVLCSNCHKELHYGLISLPD